MTFSISGKTAIVTGAANGVGLAIARHFVERGANVMFADMDESRLVSEVEEMGEAEKTRYFAGDLRQKLTIANLLSATIDAFDRVDILVNAARQVMASDPLNSDDDAVEELLQQNLISSLRLSQLIAKRMILQAEQDENEATNVGTIVNLSSIAAHRANGCMMAYSISTAALDQMTRSLAVALAPKRIRVNAVAFGSLMSVSLKKALKNHPEYREDILAHTPLGRIGEASEVAEAVQFLASSGSGFMTGDILTLDGGRSLLDAVSVPAH